MSYSVGFEGKALIQLSGMPPDAFDAMVECVVDLVDAPWDADLLDPRGDPAAWTYAVAGARTGRLASSGLERQPGKIEHCA